MSFEFSQLSLAKRGALAVAGLGIAVGAAGCAQPGAASAEGTTQSASAPRSCAPAASSEATPLFGNKTPLSTLSKTAGHLASCLEISSSTGEKKASGQFAFDESNVVTLSLTADGTVTSRHGMAELTATETDKHGTTVRTIEASANNGTFRIDVQEQSGNENLYVVAPGEPSNFCQTTPQNYDCELATGKAADADGKVLIAEVEGTFTEWMGEGATTQAANGARAKNPIPREPEFTNLQPSQIAANTF